VRDPSESPTSYVPGRNRGAHRLPATRTILMPAGNNKVKSLKNVKGSIHKAHPHSRKAKQISRSITRTNNLKEKGKVRDKEKIRQLEVLRQIHDLLPETNDGREGLSAQQLHKVILEFINRNSEEIERLKSKGNPQMSLLVELEREEMQQFNGNGIQFPDLRRKHVLDLFRNWNGIDVAELRKHFISISTNLLKS
jgi:hypothetical protein